MEKTVTGGIDRPKSAALIDASEAHFGKLAIIFHNASLEIDRGEYSGSFVLQLLEILEAEEDDISTIEVGLYCTQYTINDLLALAALQEERKVMRPISLDEILHNANYDLIALQSILTDLAVFDKLDEEDTFTHDFSDAEIEALALALRGRAALAREVHRERRSD